jgi:hypothetical protein
MLGYTGRGAFVTFREHWDECWIVDIFWFDGTGISAIMLLGLANFGDV